MKYLFIFLALIFFSTCNTSSNKSDEGRENDSINSSSDVTQSDNVSSEGENEFSAFLDNFTKTELPFTFKEYNFDQASLTQFEGTKYKNIRGDRAFHIWWAYKQIPVNEEFVAVITVELNNVNKMIPVLETYTSSGVIIDSKTLDFGWEEYTDYKDSVSINKDFSIYISAVIEEFEYDENGAEIPGTSRRKSYYRNGNILMDGNIKLSEQQEKTN